MFDCITTINCISARQDKAILTSEEFFFFLQMSKCTIPRVIELITYFITFQNQPWLSRSVVSDSLWPQDCSPPGSTVHGDSPGKNTGVGCHVLLWGNLPNPGIEPRSSALQADSLPSEPPGKPKNTGVGSLSFSRGPSWPRNPTGSPALQVGSLQAELTLWLNNSFATRIYTRMCKPALQERHSKQQNRRLVEATVALLLLHRAPAVWAHPLWQV